MGRTAGRDPDRTRRAILDAAAQVVRERGTSAPLDEVARRAGVSKGGLLYHFSGKDDLLHALAADFLERFRAAVLAAVDPDDDAPGRLVRAYVRASIEEALDSATARESLALLAHLAAVPAVAQVGREDSQRWDAELRADGLPDDVRTLVVAAADGVSAQPLWGADASAAELTALRDRLLAMTRVG
ncbi:TetR/AcrR family transcriptional regulator [Xylanimonas oleitrophica]|uniref:TetR/AcrR family transcriptional regulator n=1 Tax=Xylanimonas oleitrophica TaxID=2607479 RepID=A0A2W5XRK1_9MICO|nr:TetR/AcrR family transcriptional regulator [Xylanimonas oleitrophica]PZR52308.1 TetR/AcrR family transcriptional regulator [Xylanimonas oleitrophica]